MKTAWAELKVDVNTRFTWWWNQPWSCVLIILQPLPEPHWAHCSSLTAQVLDSPSIYELRHLIGKVIKPRSRKLIIWAPAAEGTCRASCRFPTKGRAAAGPRVHLPLPLFYWRSDSSNPESDPIPRDEAGDRTGRPEPPRSNKQTTALTALHAGGGGEYRRLITPRSSHCPSY